MIKKIRIDQLRIGMYVQEFGGSWMDHPFWRSRFTVRTDAELRRIVTGGVGELWIDTDKGLGVDDGVPGTSRKQDAREVEEQLEQLEQLATVPGLLETHSGSTQDAMGEAAALVRRSVPKLASLFSEARLGRAVDIQDCETLVEEISSSVLADPGALISVARIKTHDEYTYMHSVAVCALMVALGRQLRLKPELLRTAGLAGMLHDVGKAKMPLGVLNKPGKLRMKSSPS